MSKIFKNIVLQGYDNKPIITPVKNSDGDIERQETKLDFAIRLILMNAPLQKQQDSINGMKLAQALDAAKDKETIEIEDDIHDWLKKLAEQITPTIFRVNGNIVYKYICEAFEKE